MSETNWDSNIPCPGSSSWMHAWAETTVTAQA